MAARPTSLAAVALLALTAVAAPARGAPAEGERQFRARCASCHAVEAGQNRIAPHLAGVVGRSAGTVEGARYSAAMKGAGIVWDATTLDAYLANPRQQVPGTSMPVGLPNAGQRAQVIEYLQSLSGGE